MSAVTYPAVQRCSPDVGTGPEAIGLAVIRQALWDLNYPDTREDARAFLFDPDRREDRAFWCRAADISTDALEALGGATSKPDPRPEPGVEFDTNDQRNLRTRLIGSSRPKWSSNYHSVTTWRPSRPADAGRESELERIRRLDRETNLLRREMSDQAVTFLPFSGLDDRYLCYDRVAWRIKRGGRESDGYEAKSTAYTRGGGKHRREARGF